MAQAAEPRGSSEEAALLLGTAGRATTNQEGSWGGAQEKTGPARGAEQPGRRAVLSEAVW